MVSGKFRSRNAQRFDLSAWPDDGALRAFLASCSRRIRWIAAASGAAIGVVTALLISALAWPPDVTTVLTLGVAGLVLGGPVALRWPRRTPLLVEARAPECRNLVITAAELIARPDRVRPYVSELVLGRAAAAVSRLDPAVLFPARRALLALAGALTLWLLTLALLAVRPTNLPGTRESTTPSTEAPAIASIDVTITPPSYSGRGAEMVHDPVRIQALAGSRIHLSVRTNAASAAVHTVTGRRPLRADSAGRFVGEIAADADGYIMIEAVEQNASIRRLIGLSVTADQPPRLLITAPARDLLLPDARRTIDIMVASEDDLALGSLALRYTRVTGSGELFTFTEGELPLQISREHERRWTGRAALRLETLALGAGDLVVYRGVATDRRPGAAAAESDAYIVEIAAPGELALEGVSIDEPEDKYAISQQMVILKTERLIARAAALPAESVAVEARAIAAEQRSVRAEFVFMMGGELAEEVFEAAGITDLDETAHAAADDEVIAGRLANRGRLDLLNAIRAMSRASAALNAPSLAQALNEEKVALGSLQRAFTRTRYILRALTRRERLDFSRRLTGELAGVVRGARPRADPEIEPRLIALRRALAGVAALAGETSQRRESTTRASQLAQTILQIDLADESLQQSAAFLNDAERAIAQRRYEDAQTLLEQSALRLAAVLRAELASAPPRSASFQTRRLQGSVADALRNTR